jgi:hypothetical protein
MLLRDIDELANGLYDEIGLVALDEMAALQPRMNSRPAIQNALKRVEQGFSPLQRAWSCLPADSSAGDGQRKTLHHTRGGVRGCVSATGVLSWRPMTN